MIDEPKAAARHRRCFLSIGLLIPAIPKYVAGPLGHSAGMVGACLAITSVTAVLARPLAGRLADRRGRGTAACAGALTLALSSFTVLLADSLPLFLRCRAIAGAGEALTYVGLAAAASDHDRPGMAINHFSIVVNAGLLAGPALAGAVHSAAGSSAVWTLSGVVAVGATGICLFLPKSADLAARDAPVVDADRRSGPLLNRAGLRPGLAYLASVWGYTAFSAFLPLHITVLGGGDSGRHFLVYGCVLLAVRLGGQRPLARVAPNRAASTALALTGGGLVLLAAWPSAAGTLAAAAVIGAGQALGLPAFLAMAVARLPAEQRGSAVATTAAFFDVGFLAAALALDVVTQTLGLTYGFAVAGGVSAAALLLFLPRYSRVP